MWYFITMYLTGTSINSTHRVASSASTSVGSSMDPYRKNEIPHQSMYTIKTLDPNYTSYIGQSPEIVRPLPCFNR